MHKTLKSVVSLNISDGVGYIGPYFQDKFTFTKYKQHNGKYKIAQ